MRGWIHALLSLTLAGCEAGMTVVPSRDASGDRVDGARPAEDSGPGADVVTPRDGFTPGGDSAAPADAAVLGTGASRPEICGNAFDDDGNGLIDDGCDCAVGTNRGCWLGPPENRNVGACHDGVQRCESDGTHATWSFCMDSVMPAREVLANGRDDDCDGTTDEPDGICAPRANVESGTDCANGLDDDCDTLVDCADPGCVGVGRCTPACTTRESVCWGGADEDCDHATDCDDSDCAADPSCQTGPCPAGQTPTYRQRSFGVSWGSSSISMGDGRPAMPMSCEPGMCGRGEVAVVLTGMSAVCVPPPRSCPAGQSPTYVASGTWRCDPPCDLLVHYGALFGGRTVCAGRPNVSCTAGQSPTFDQATETWVCRPTCNNSTYDQIVLGGQVVCVPC